MINKLDVLIKCITLLYREKLLSDLNNNELTDNSKDVVRTILNTFKNDKKQLQGGDSLIVSDLQNLVTDMMTGNISYDKDTLLQSLRVLLANNDTIYNVLEKAIEAEIQPNGLKNSIVSLRKTLTTYYREVEITNLISKASYQLNMGKLDIPISEYITNLTSNLEALNSNAKSKDPGIVDELDMTNEEELEAVVDKVHELNHSAGKFITGWKHINRMLNGGFRKGEQWLVAALQHNYKSGFMQSLFVQFCTLNKPVLKDPDRKPMILYISLEDDMNIMVEFMYRYMYFNEHKEVPNLDNVSKKDMSSYISGKLGVNGFHGKIIRVNPSEWTYKNIFNKVLEFESTGYEVQVLIVDYLSKLPTTFCDTSGPTGTAVRDLFNRLRNFCSAKEILMLSPHQLSSDAMQLFRSGVTGFDFIDEITSKNFFSDSKQISQIVDGEIYLTKGKVGGRNWGLYIGKGKHRSPTITPDEWKRVMLPFPKGAPIPEDLFEDDEHTISGSSGDDRRDKEFDF